MGEDRLARLAVEDRAALQVAADRDAHDHRARERAVRTPARGRRFRLAAGSSRATRSRRTGSPAHGRSPRIAWPTARPMMFASASGVLKQRASPNARCRPNVMPNTPPLPGTSSMTCGIGVGDVLAEHADAFVERHLLVQREPDRLAERDELGVGRRPAGSPGSSTTGSGPSTWSTTDAGAGRGAASACSAAARTVSLASARICSACSGVSAPASISCCSSTVIGSCSRSSSSSSGHAVLLLVVGERVRVRPGDERVDETRSRAGAHVRDRVRALAPHLEVVAAVHLHDVQAADAAHHLRDRRRVLVGRPHRDRVAVVGDDEQHREVQPGRGVERLPELAFGGRALAERHVRDLVAVRGAARQVRAPADVARRLRATDRGQALARRCTDVWLTMLSRGRSPVARHLPSAGRGIGRGADRLHQHLERRDAERERQRAVAVVGEEPVVARPAGSARGRAAAPRGPRRRSGRTRGSAGAARSRGRRRSGRRARGGSRRAPRRGRSRLTLEHAHARPPSVDRCGVVHCGRVYGLPWVSDDLAPLRRSLRGPSCAHDDPDVAAWRPADAAREAFVSPAVRGLAARAGCRRRRRCSARGAGGRVTRDDVRGAAASGRTSATRSSPFDNIRKRTAVGLLASKQHVCAHAVRRRGRLLARSKPYAARRAARAGLTAACRSSPAPSSTRLREFPLLNATLDGDDASVVHRAVHLGIAVDLDFEGLVVPVVHDADGLRLRALAAAIRDVAARARARKLVARRPRGRHVHDHEPGRVGHVDLVPGHQPAAGRRSSRPTACRSRSSSTTTGGSAIAPVGHLCLRVRPPRRRRRVRGRVPRARAARSSRRATGRGSSDRELASGSSTSVGVQLGRCGHRIAARGRAAGDRAPCSRCRSSGSGCS